MDEYKDCSNVSLQHFLDLIPFEKGKCKKLIDNSVLYDKPIFPSLSLNGKKNSIIIIQVYGVEITH